VATDYDKIADDYKQTKKHGFKQYGEEYTVLTLAGPLGGKDVIDLACGDGHYTRMLKERGAEHIVGVDVSGKMIENARAQEAEKPLGIDYLIQDARYLESIGRFDLAVAAFFFPYISTEEGLENASEAIVRNLKSDGRLIALTINPDIPQVCPSDMEKYGFAYKTEGPLHDSTIVNVTLFIDGGSLDFINYYWSRETYERVLKTAGFQEVIWHPIRISDEGVKAYGPEHWESVLRTPLLTALEARM
jgi:SAM-dependent methyltransferase